MTTQPLIEVSELAAEKLGEIIKEQGEDDGTLLRIMVMAGPGGGPQYMLGLEKEPKEDDVIIETKAIRVLVDSDSAPLVEGAQIDYMESLERSGFVISNPNFASGGCGSGGCGCGAGGGGGCGCGAGGGGGCGCGGH